MPRVAFPLARIQWLLGLAALCMFAQSTLLPLTSLPSSAWTPVHRHLTLNGVVPSHTHTYERPEGDAARGPSCIVTDASTATAGGVHNEPVVCAPDDSASTTVTATVQHEPATLPVTLQGIEALAPLSSEGAWSSVVLAILTPPPRA